MKQIDKYMIFSNFYNFFKLKQKICIYTGKTSIDGADMDQTNLLDNIVDFNNKSRKRSKENQDKKRNNFNSVSALY